MRPISLLNGLDPVRIRPRMYVGSTGKEGYHQLLWEVVNNGLLETIFWQASKITVQLHADKRTVTVEDDGRGISVEIPSKCKKSVLELQMSHIPVGRIDLYGPRQGFPVVNALSSQMIIETKIDGMIFRQGYSRGIVQSPVHQIRKCSTTGLRVTFTPDPDIFGQDLHFDTDMIREKLNYVWFKCDDT